MTTLADLAAQGYVIDEWERWQQGDCWQYAAGLCALTGGRLRFGALYEKRTTRTGEVFWIDYHYFAHDDEFAYDSAGRHPLPYRGITHIADHVDLDGQAVWYRCEPIEPDELAEVRTHALRNDILTEEDCNA